MLEKDGGQKLIKSGFWWCLCRVAKAHVNTTPCKKTENFQILTAHAVHPMSCIKISRIIGKLKLIDLRDVLNTCTTILFQRSLLWQHYGALVSIDERLPSNLASLWNKQRIPTFWGLNGVLRLPFTHFCYPCPLHPGFKSVKESGGAPIVQEAAQVVRSMQRFGFISFLFPRAFHH